MASAITRSGYGNWWCSSAGTRSMWAAELERQATNYHSLHLLFHSRPPQGRVEEKSRAFSALSWHLACSDCGVSETAPLPIAIFLTTFQPGGTERQMIELVRRLDRSRWDVHVACFRAAGAWYGRVAEAASSVTDLRNTGQPQSDTPTPLD